MSEQEYIKIFILIEHIRKREGGPATCAKARASAEHVGTGRSAKKAAKIFSEVRPFWTYY